jgi:hypothetical protein
MLKVRERKWIHCAAIFRSFESSCSECKEPASTSIEAKPRLRKKKTSSAHGKPLKQKQAFLSACHCKDTNSVELYRERRASNSSVSGCFHVTGGYPTKHLVDIFVFFAVNTWWILLGDKQAKRH